MIHHISIAAREPRRVAAVLAELWEGYSFPFPPFPESYIAMPGDRYGTAIEVTPLGLELAPGVGDEEAQASPNESPSPFTATHAALSVPVSEERVREIAAREGCALNVRPRRRLPPRRIWVENRLLVECSPPDAADYLDT